MSISPGTMCPILTELLCMLSMAVTRFSSDGVAICWRLPVLWTTSRLHGTARNGRAKKAYTQRDSPDDSTDLTPRRILTLTYQGQHRIGSEFDIYDRPVKRRGGFKEWPLVQWPTRPLPYGPRRPLMKISKKICITAAKTGFLLLQTLYGR